MAKPARRAVDRLPAKVAIAVLDFLLRPLLANPERVGQPLRGGLAGFHSTRVGTYRVVYEINHDAQVVQVVSIDHRADLCRSR